MVRGRISREHFTPEQMNAIDGIADQLDTFELLNFINEQLNKPEYTINQLRYFLQKHPEIKERVRPVKRKGGGSGLFSAEEIQKIKAKAPTCTFDQLCTFIREDLGRSELDRLQVSSWVRYRPEVHSKLQKENAMVKRVRESKAVTEKAPIGALSFHPERGVMVKLSSDFPTYYGNYVKRARMVWENAYGYTDKSIVHLDGDRENDALENLYAASNSAMAYLSTHEGWVFDDPELMKARLLRAEIEVATKRKARKSDNSQNQSTEKRV